MQRQIPRGRVCRRADPRYSTEQPVVAVPRPSMYRHPTTSVHGGILDGIVVGITAK